MTLKVNSTGVHRSRSRRRRRRRRGQVGQVREVIGETAKERERERERQARLFYRAGRRTRAESTEYNHT